MRSIEIYESAREKAFSRIRHQRDAHAPKQIEIDPEFVEGYRMKLFNIEDEEFQSYAFIMREAEARSYEMFKEIVLALLKKYGIKHTVDDYKYDERRGIHQPILVFVTDEDRTAYIIIKFGFMEINHKLEVSIMIANNAKKHKTVMMSHEYAYRVNLSHNDDKNDPTRGTGIYSIKDMFVTLFGEEEYECFKEFELEYTQNVRKYLGYQLVKTLTPNALYSFKKTVEYALLTFSYKAHMDELSSTLIPNEKYEIIRNQFITKKYYKALIGKSDFAQSFMTAEWLYDTMKTAGKIDYAAVSMGYFKAVEQLMFGIIKRHVGEGRTLCKSRHVHSPNKYIDLSEMNLLNGAIDTSLGSLIAFLKYARNRDLLLNNIRTDTAVINAINSIFDHVREDRNGYFHKDNIEKWDLIEEARSLAYVTMILLIGAYNFSEEDRIQLNIPGEKVISDYERFCEYMNYNMDQLFYICFEEGGDIIPVFANADDGLEIDDYGDPKYSGAYYHRVFGIGSGKEVVSINALFKRSKLVGEKEKINALKMPLKIYTGIMRPVKEGMEFSGPLELIYDNGKLNLPGQPMLVKY